MKTFYIKTRVFVGSDSMSSLSVYKGKTIWIVCDSFLEQSGGLQHVLDHLDAGNKVEIHTEVIPDPPLESITAGVSKMSRLQPNVVIALGGGSAIDTAKGIIYFSKQLGVHIETFIAIPTTSGTGSEVTNVTVITDTQNKVKLPIKDNDITPDIAILDPKFTLSVPYDVTANTGIDVLTHAIEAYASQNATLCSDGMAEKAVHLVVEYLPKCCQELQNEYFREVMHSASTMAGMAFNIAGLGLNHSIAHQIGAHFKVPHGLANGMLLPHVIEFNSSHSLTACAKYAALARSVGVVNNLSPDFLAADAFRKALAQLMRQLKMPLCLAEFGVSKERALADADAIAEQALKDMCLETNPCPAAPEDVTRILTKLTEAHF
jgi:1-propanol dehydrogenase